MTQLGKGADEILSLGATGQITLGHMSAVLLRDATEIGRVAF
jgi:hypothetical protein